MANGRKTAQEAKVEKFNEIKNLMKVINREVNQYNKGTTTDWGEVGDLEYTREMLSRIVSTLTGSED